MVAWSNCYMVRFLNLLTIYPCSHETITDEKSLFPAPYRHFNRHSGAHYPLYPAGPIFDSGVICRPVFDPALPYHDYFKKFPPERVTFPGNYFPGCP